MKEKRNRLSPRFGKSQGLSRWIGQSRYQAWANAFANKFRLEKNVFAWRPESFVQSLRARSVFAFFRNQFRLYQAKLISRPAEASVNNVFVRQSVRFFPTSPSLPPSIDGRQQSDRNMRAAPVLQASQRNRRRSTSHERVSEALHASVRSAVVSREFIEIRKRILQRETVATNSVSNQVSVRITRQLQRAEERPPAQRPDPPGVSAVRARGEFVLEASRPVVREFNANKAWDAPPMGVSSPPSLNVNQFTDEVLRQLDRRWVSERERMGKM